MKKVLLLMFAALFTWASCSNDNKGELDGNWDEMKISAENVLLDTSKNEGVFINVSKEGANFSLQVDNYNGWWVSSVSEKTTEMVILSWLIKLDVIKKCINKIGIMWRLMPIKQNVL